MSFGKSEIHSNFHFSFVAFEVVRLLAKSVDLISWSRCVWLSSGHTSPQKPLLESVLIVHFRYIVRVLASLNLSIQPVC